MMDDLDGDDPTAVCTDKEIRKEKSPTEFKKKNKSKIKQKLTTGKKGNQLPPSDWQKIIPRTCTRLKETFF